MYPYVNVFSEYRKHFQTTQAVSTPVLHITGSCLFSGVQKSRVKEQADKIKMRLAAQSFEESRRPCRTISTCGRFIVSAIAPFALGDLVTGSLRVAYSISSCRHSYTSANTPLRVWFSVRLFVLMHAPKSMRRAQRP